MSRIDEPGSFSGARNVSSRSIVVRIPTAFSRNLHIAKKAQEPINIQEVTHEPH